jgi:hypothetical protein
MYDLELQYNEELAKQVLLSPLYTVFLLASALFLFLSKSFYRKMYQV